MIFTSFAPDPKRHSIFQRLSAAAALFVIAAVSPARGVDAIPSDARRNLAAQESALHLPASSDAGSLLAARAKNAPLELLGRGSEFGEQAILRRRAHVEPWTASADALLSYTDNVGLTPSGKQEDWYLRTGASIGYTNRIKGPAFCDFSLQHYLFRYAEFDALDFDHTRLEAGLVIQLPWLDDAFLTTRYAYQRIAEPFGGRLFDSHSIVFGLQKVWKISRGQQVYAGLSADCALASSPSAAERDEYSFVLGYNARLTQKLSAQASYRVSWYRYDEGGRKDWNQILALGLSYDLTDWARISATTSFSRNTSNRPFAEYDNFVAGLGLNLHISF